jgi:hypothetical protein
MTATKPQEFSAEVRGQYEDYPYPSRDPEKEGTFFACCEPQSLMALSHSAWGGKRDLRKVTTHIGRVRTTCARHERYHLANAAFAVHQLHEGLTMHRFGKHQMRCVGKGARVTVHLLANTCLGQCCKKIINELVEQRLHGAIRDDHVIRELGPLHRLFGHVEIMFRHVAIDQLSDAMALSRAFARKNGA